MKNIEQSTNLVNVVSCIQSLQENYDNGWCAYNTREKILYELKIYTEKDVASEREYIEKQKNIGIGFLDRFCPHSVGDYSLLPVTSPDLDRRGGWPHYEKNTITLKHLEVAEWEVIKNKLISFTTALDNLNKGISVAAVDFQKGRKELKNVDDMVKYLKSEILSGLYYYYYVL